MRVSVRPELIAWASERGGPRASALAKKFPKLEAWRQGEVKPTFKQLEAFAQATHTPFGYFFLPEPPVERVPIPDFRTVGSALIDQPSPDLLDTIYLCQQRQEWYREFARAEGDSVLPFVGSVALGDDVVATATRIGESLGFSLEERRRMPTWTEALRRFIEQADALGVLVMINGVVGSNTHRKLDPNEFRGFALADPLAPLVFINGADTKSAQMFTLAHELVHLWLGETALSDAVLVGAPSNQTEQWCNKVAAEMLVPLADLRREFRRGADISDEVARLARQFKVSTLVILRRIHDSGGLTYEQLWAEYDAELARLQARAKTPGGDFYLTTAARVGKRFARAVVTATWEGRSSFTEASRLLGFKSMATFRELGVSLGVTGGV